MVELTEFEKTLTELYRTNGRQGLHQYFVHDGMTDDQAEEHIDSNLHVYQQEENATVFVSTRELDNMFSEYPADVKNSDIVSTTTIKGEGEFINGEPTTTKMVVTFVDGSQKEIEVANDGTVVSPAIPGADALNAQQYVMPEELVGPREGESKRSFTARLKKYYKTIGLSK